MKSLFFFLLLVAATLLLHSFQYLRLSASGMSSRQDSIPEVRLEKVVMKPMTVLYIADTAFVVNEMSVKIGKDYSELFGFIYPRQLKSGKVMAIYQTMKEPFVFDAAVEVDQVPAQLPGRIRSKIINGGEALLAHVKGPYEKLGIAYNQISEWMKSNQKQAAGPAIEVYLNDPVSVANTNELLTDVYQGIQ